MKINLHGGPWNNKRIDDSGVCVIRMSIAKEWDGNRPKVGTETGSAYYEPTSDRSIAHWSHNEWEGKCIGTY